MGVVYRREAAASDRTGPVASRNRRTGTVAELHNSLMRTAEAVAPRSPTASPAPGGMPVA
jgi:hypothetical protein